MTTGPSLGHRVGRTSSPPHPCHTSSIPAVSNCPQPPALAQWLRPFDLSGRMLLTACSPSSRVTLSRHSSNASSSRKPSLTAPGRQSWVLLSLEAPVYLLGQRKGSPSLQVAKLVSAPLRELMHAEMIARMKESLALIAWPCPFFPNSGEALSDVA